MSEPASFRAEAAGAEAAGLPGPDAEAAGGPGPEAAPDAAAWDRRYADRELLWTAEPNRFVADATRDLTPGRALDLAAGEGRNAVWLAERGWQVTAVDFSTVGLAKARQLAARRGVTVAWVTADLVEWEPPRAAFDLVVIAYLHAGPRLLATVLERAVDALAPGGTLVVVGHDVDNLEHGHGGPPDPALLYTVDGLAGALSGLTIVRAEQVRRPVDLDDGTRVDALDALVVARRPDQPR